MLIRSILRLEKLQMDRRRWTVMREWGWLRDAWVSYAGATGNGPSPSNQHVVEEHISKINKVQSV